MKKAVVLLLVFCAVVGCGTALGEWDRERSLFRVQSTDDERWRVFVTPFDDVATNTINFTQDTHTGYTERLEPGDLIAVSFLSGIPGLPPNTAATIDRYDALNGCVLGEKADGSLEFHEFFMSYTSLIPPEGTDPASLIGNNYLIPAFRLHLTGDGLIILYAEAMIPIEERTGTITELGDDSMVLSSGEGDLRLAIDEKTMVRYPISAGRDASVRYAANDSGELVAISIMPVNG